MKSVYFVSIFWGIFSAMLGFTVMHDWQAWVMIIAGNVSWFIGTLSRS